MSRGPEATLLESAARRFAGCGAFARRYARHKLRLDPVFVALLAGEKLPPAGRLLDIGCGQGLLAALLAAAHECFAAGAWPAAWAPPPRLDILGIDSSAPRVRVARLAAGSAARFEEADVRDAALAPCSAAVLIDVMFYLEEREQERLFARVASALAPGGVILMREPDAGAGLAFHCTKWAERIAGVAFGRPRWRLHYRPAADWAAFFDARGFDVEREGMSRGTPFANVLFTARRRVS